MYVPLLNGIFFISLPLRRCIRAGWFEEDISFDFLWTQIRREPTLSQQTKRLIFGISRALNATPVSISRLNQTIQCMNTLLVILRLSELVHEYFNHRKRAERKFNWSHMFWVEFCMVSLRSRLRHRTFLSFFRWSALISAFRNGSKFLQGDLIILIIRASPGLKVKRFSRQASRNQVGEPVYCS
jgi:hypothetical protein